MSEEAQEQVTEQVVELTPTEQQAYAMGWRPKDEWSGDPDDWKDARSFIREGEMMDRIKKQGNAIDRYKDELALTKKEVQEIAEHNKKIALLEYNKALKDLKKQRREALRNDEHEIADEIEDEIDQLKEQHSQVTQEAKTDTTQTTSELTEDQKVLQKWLNNPENRWYFENYEMNNEADRYFKFIRMTEPSVEEALKKADNYIRNKFKDFFNKGASHSMVMEPDTTGERRSSSKKKFSKRDLNEDQLRIGNTFVRSGVMKDIQEYVDQLAELGELN